MSGQLNDNEPISRCTHSSTKGPTPYSNVIPLTLRDIHRAAATEWQGRQRSLDTKEEGEERLQGDAERVQRREMLRGEELVESWKLRRKVR